MPPSSRKCSAVPFSAVLLCVFSASAQSAKRICEHFGALASTLPTDLLAMGKFHVQCKVTMSCRSFTVDSPNPPTVDVVHFLATYCTCCGIAFSHDGQWFPSRDSCIFPLNLDVTTRPIAFRGCSVTGSHNLLCVISSFTLSLLQEIDIFICSFQHPFQGFFSQS